MYYFTLFLFKIFYLFFYSFIFLLSVQMLCGYSVSCTVLYVLDFSNKKTKQNKNTISKTGLEKWNCSDIYRKKNNNAQYGTVLLILFSQDFFSQYRCSKQ